MLLQSILGISDKDIVEDYFLSNSAQGMPVADLTADPKKNDRKVFVGASREAMVQTLAFLRETYGSVSPGYIDYIGFNTSWRNRLLQVVQRSKNTNKRNTST